MYVDTTTFWVCIIGLGIALAWCWYSLSTELKSRPKIEYDLARMVGFLYLNAAILIDDASKEAKIKLDRLWEEKGDEVDKASDRIQEALKKDTPNA